MTLIYSIPVYSSFVRCTSSIHTISSVIISVLSWLRGKNLLKPCLPEVKLKKKRNMTKDQYLVPMIETSRLWIWTQMFMVAKIQTLIHVKFSFVSSDLYHFLFFETYILSHTGLTWTYLRPYAHTRWQLWGSNSWPLGSEAWPLKQCAIGADCTSW